MCLQQPPHSCELGRKRIFLFAVSQKATSEPAKDLKRPEAAKDYTGLPFGLHKDLYQPEATQYLVTTKGRNII